MSLNYVAKNKRIDDFDANVACADYLYELHKVLGLPLAPGERRHQPHRVPYKMGKLETKRCAARIRSALILLGAVPDDQPWEIGADPTEKENRMTSTAQIAESWAEFLEACDGYRAE